jgi:hypothetical protein
MAKIKVKAYGGNKANPNAQTPKAKTYEGNKSTSAKKFVEPKKGTDVGYGYKVGEGEMGKKEIPVKQQAKMASVSATYKKK